MGWRVKGILIGILILGALLRVRGIDNPLLDDQGWRQADTASMALNMVGHLGDFPDVLFPTLNYDGVGPQKVELEFPFLPYLLALTWTIVGSADVSGRIWAILFSLLTLWGVFEFGRRAFSVRVGILSAALYAVIPLTAYYGRVVMPEPVSQAFSIWALNAIMQWRDHPSKGSLLWASFMMSAAILAKLPQLMIFPVVLWMGFWPFRGKGKKMLQFSVGALFLPLLYYSWVHGGSGESSQFVSGIVSEQVVEGPEIFVDSLIKNLREGIGFPILALAGVGIFRITWAGLRARGEKQGVFGGVFLWGLITLLYLLVICIRIPLDYYLVPAVLLLVLCAGVALEPLDDIPAGVIGVLLISLLLVNFTFLYESKYQWDDRYLTQANWLREHTDQQDVLILSDSPPMTLYYAQRYGFRLISEEDNTAWEELQSLKGQYFIGLPDSRGAQFWNKVKETYPSVGPGIYRLEPVEGD